MNIRHDYSTKALSKALIGDILMALKGVKSHGSVEIFVQKGIVTQITTRNIKKTGPTNGS